MRSILASIFLFLSFAPQDSHAQFSLDKKAIRRLDSLLDSRGMEKPGAVLAISSGNELIYERAAGLASLEWNTAMTTDALFEAASVSKQFTAATVLKLIEEGKLSLDDDVRNYIPELPDYGYVITIRHLLTMTSGLRDWRNVTYLMGKATFSSTYTQAEATEIICRQQTLNFPPGEQYSYSNSNYDLLNEIVQRVTNESFVRYSTREILDPVGFMAARWRTNPFEITRKRVDSYNYNRTSEKYIRTDLLERTHGAAGMLVTATDLLRWNNHWAKGNFGPVMDSLRVLQGVLNNGNEIAYACGGVRVTTHAGLREITHRGLIAGFRAFIAYYPELDVSVACLTNDRTFEMDEMHHLIGELLTGKTIEAPKAGVELSGRELEDLRGLYKAHNHFRSFEIKTDGGVATIGKDTLVAITRDTLMLGKAAYYIGPNRSITVYSADEVQTYRQVDSFDPGASDLRKFEGHYSSEELLLDLELRQEDGKLFAYRAAHDRMTLNPLYKDEGVVGFYAFTNGLRTVFEFTKKGELTVSIPRAEHFSFIKK